MIFIGRPSYLPPSRAQKWLDDTHFANANFSKSKSEVYSFNMSSKLDHLVFYVAKDQFEKVVVSLVTCKAPFQPRKCFRQRLENFADIWFMILKAWYLAALAPLKYEKILDFGETVGLGARPSKKDDAGSIMLLGQQADCHFFVYQRQM